MCRRGIWTAEGFKGERENMVQFVSFEIKIGPGGKSEMCVLSEGSCNRRRTTEHNRQTSGVWFPLLLSFT
jgi:hypothetical protein